MLSENEIRALRAEAVDLDGTEDIVQTLDYVLGDVKVSPLDPGETDEEDTDSDDLEFDEDEETDDEDEEEDEEE